jgi:hypothetical protein
MAERPAAASGPWSAALRDAQDTDYEKSSRIDVLACSCGGRLEMLELVTDKAEICAALDRLHLDDEPRARSTATKWATRVSADRSARQCAPRKTNPRRDSDGLQKGTGALGFGQPTLASHIRALRKLCRLSTAAG